MGDSKSVSKLVSFTKGDHKTSADEKKSGDAKENYSQNELVTKKTRGKMSDNDASESASQKKKKKRIGSEGTLSGASDASILTEDEKESRVTDKIKAFGRKGAAAKQMAQTQVIAGQAAEGQQEALKRRRKSSAIETLIRPAEEETAETTTTEPSSKPPTDKSAAVTTEKREAELMHEKLLQEEQEDQALATFVLDLVKKKRKEKEDAAEIVLTESETLIRSRNMSPLEKAGIICVLEETIAKLSILGYTHGKPIVKPEIKYVSLLDKLAEKEESALVDLIKSNKSPEDHETEKHFIKLQKDRGFLQEALTLTLLEMKQEGTFGILQDIVHLEEAIVKEEADLRFEGKARQQEVNHCKALLESDNRKNTKKLEDRTAILAKLKDEIQNVLYYNGLKFKYLDHWESSRVEQNTMMLQNKEKELDRKLQDYEEMTSIEVRCNAEMKAFIDENIKILTQKIEEWMEKYESEMEEREYKINKLKEEREEHLKQLQDKTELFNERQRQMDEWKAYKEQKRLKAEHLAHLNSMATRIQAWWRGTMVRRGLGPYRKKRGKHGKKGAK